MKKETDKKKITCHELFVACLCKVAVKDWGSTGEVVKNYAWSFRRMEKSSWLLQRETLFICNLRFAKEKS